MKKEELTKKAIESYAKKLKDSSYYETGEEGAYICGYIAGAKENQPTVEEMLKRLLKGGYVTSGIREKKEHAQQWHKIFTDSTPYNYEYWDLPQETLPQIENFYFVKLKNGFIKICELKYDVHSKKKYFYDLHGWTQSDVAEWLDYPKELVE